ncbi:ATP-binding cassette domain-containing protein [Cryobacterium lyxosi]|nr:ATP-binding cassette domain-containing protein [Cryobacterium lyxosi]
MVRPYWHDGLASTGREREHARRRADSAHKKKPRGELIEIVNVSKHFGTREVLSEVSFTARDGEVTGFVGPNGAGKSTLLKIVAGTIIPTAGSVKIDGGRYRDAVQPGAVLGAFLSAELVPEHLTASSYLAYICDVQGLSRRSVNDALELVGLSAARKQKVRTFSLGMRQRLGIASVVVGNPQNLILDEPINGLDPDAILWLRHFVANAAQKGKTVLLSSHHMAELSMVADSIVLLNGGRVTLQGALEAFLSADAKQVYFEASDVTGAVAELNASGFRATLFESGAIVTDAEAGDVGRAVYQSGRELEHLSVIKQTLEETYFKTLSAASGAGQKNEVQQ